MGEETNQTEAENAAPQTPKALSPEAKRALEEAEARKAAYDAANNRPKEINGRGGLDPARFGDWEVKGISSDF